MREKQRPCLSVIGEEVRMAEVGLPVIQKCLPIASLDLFPLQGFRW